MRKRGIIIVFLGFFLAGFSRAKIKMIKDPLLKADLGSESASGATNAVAALGNGRLTVGISPWSELVYFRYPNPSYYDHLRYFTRAGGLLGFVFVRDMRWSEDAPSRDWAKYGRPLEKYPGLGARAGIYFSDGTLNWFGDETWTSSRSYQPEWGTILCTSLTNHRAQAKICQWVDPELALLVQEFKISSAQAEKFFYYATFSPWKGLDPGYKEPDSPKAGFAGIYLSQEKLILYFYPESPDPKRLKNLSSPFTSELIDRLYPEGGIFIAMALEHPEGEFQVGADRRGRRVEKTAPLSASRDALDGKLSGSQFYLGSVDAGLGASLSQGETQAVVYISVADSAQKASQIIQTARSWGVKELKNRTLREAKELSQKIFIPAGADEIETRLARRSLLNLLVGRDRDTGAIVASPSRQPAYHYDWPRDGAFFDLALDLAGFPELASEHLEFYRRTQRKEKWDWSWIWLLGLKSPLYSPRGHWYVNMNTDGTPGKLKILPFEIDETALVLWDLWRHQQFLSPEEQVQAKEQFRQMLILSADALVKYVEEKKGWVKKALEDDNAFPQATLHGASSVLTGLAGAIALGEKWSLPEEKVLKWKSSAQALRRGILARLKDDKTLEKGGWRGIQWSLFPAPVFKDYNHPLAQKLIKKLAEEIQKKINHTRPGFAYLGEQLFIFTLATHNQPQYQPLVRQALEVLIKKAPVPGTDCYGEVALWIKLAGEKEPFLQNRTSIPHLWTGVCSYLSVLAYYQPELFFSQIPPLPE